MISGLRRYWIVTALILVSFLMAFLLVEALEVPLLTDPSPRIEQEGGLAAMAVGVGLLIFDVVLPVPSSLVMIAHGALFGVIFGTLLSLVGSTGAMLVGFAFGRLGGPLLERLVSREERTRADQLLTRWGALAIIVTRPIPLLAETTAILAGASPMGWGRALLAGIAGSLPGALLYALTGALATSFENGVLVFGLVLAIVTVSCLVGRKLEHGRDNTTTLATRR